MIRLALLSLFISVVGCNPGASPTILSAASVRTDGPEEMKLLAGQPSIGFLPRDLDVAAERATFGAVALSPGVLVWDAKSGTTPPNWRATDQLDPGLAAGGIDITGLDTLHVAGSGVYDQTQFHTALELAATLGKPLRVLGLRQEPTGFIGVAPFSMYGFANNTPNDWSNAGLGDHDVKKRNAAILDAVAAAPTVVLYVKSALKSAVVHGQLPPPQSVTPTGVMSEEDFVQSKGADYEQVRITDHGIPTFDAVDEIVDEIGDAQADGALLYVHCAGGDGRTTTVMAMADMLQNASRGVSFAAIVARQLAIGGEDLTVTTDAGTRGQLQAARLGLLQTFYAYAQANPTGSGVKFSDWAGANGISEYQPIYSN